MICHSSYHLLLQAILSLLHLQYLFFGNRLATAYGNPLKQDGSRHQVGPTCENLKSCIQCHVFHTGPLVEDDDCNFFCSHYPSPTVVDILVIGNNEKYCSFLEDSSHSSEKEVCRFIFKIGGTVSKSSIQSQKGVSAHRMNAKSEIQNSDLYIVVKRSKLCDSRQFANPFPRSIVLGKEDVDSSVFDADEPFLISKIFINLFLASLSSIAIFCYFCKNNIARLPCGLCNTFNSPTSAFLSNPQLYRDNDELFMESISIPAEPI